VAITFPLSNFLRIAIRNVALAGSLLDQLLEQRDELPSPYEWRRFVLQYDRSTPTGTTEDLAQIGFDVVNFTDGEIDSTWTTADHTAVHNALFAWDAAWKSLRTSTSSLKAIKAYRRAFADPMTIEKRFQDGGPPTWNSVQAVPGTSAANPLPYQVAMSLTMKTPWPRHWGRVYLPGLTEDAVTTNGRWDSADIDTLKAASETLFEALWDAQLPVCVASTQVDKVLMGNLLLVRELQIDDIPDIIRRRRPRQPAIRNVTVLD